ncbi:MAG: Wzz/FepE/Etk N-terminal domain-containing protein [candidate division WOR-3 bacterium]
MNRLLQYLRVVIKWRRLIFYNTLVMTVLAVVISFILPQRFTAVAQLLPPPEDDMLGMSSILGSSGFGTSRLSRLRLGSMLGGSTPSDLMVGIMGSRSVMQKVVERCSIIYHYRIKKNSIESAIKTLRKLTNLSVSDDGIVKIRVDAKTPALAAAIANSYVEELDDFLRHSNISRGRNMRLFLERRVEEVESSLAVARESLEAFQQRHKTVSVNDETKAAVEAYAKLKSQLYLRQAELGMVEEVSGLENPYATSLRGEVDAFQNQLKKLERGGSRTGFGAGFGVPFESLPSVAAEFLRRYQDLKIQEETYAMLYQQYEYAKILEARDTPSITVLDYAVPPEKRSFPRRLVITLAVLCFSLLASIAFALVSEYFHHLSVTRPQEYAGWQEVGAQIVQLLRRPKRADAGKTV